LPSDLTHADNGSLNGESVVSVVMAIDLGTSCSGLSYAFVKNDDKIESDQMWPMSGSSRAPSLKTPTAVLLAPDATFVAFGEVALQKYIAMDPAEQLEHYYFDRFKMALYLDAKEGSTAKEGSDLTKSTVTARNGKSLPLITVFAHALRYLRDHGLQRLKSVTGNAINMEDIRWVITLPAIWSEKSKHVMRLAAAEAGFLDGSANKQQKFMLALESEAAALCCRYYENKLSDNLTQVNTKLVVLDLGGGTMDVTSHIVRNDSSVGEVHQSDGNDCGSWKIDLTFAHWLKEAFGTAEIEKYQRDFQGDFFELQNAFENAKHNVSPTIVDQTMNYYRISLPHSFITNFFPSTTQNPFDPITVWPKPKSDTLKTVTNRLANAPVPTCLATTAIWEDLDLEKAQLILAKTVEMTRTDVKDEKKDEKKDVKSMAEGGVLDNTLTGLLDENKIGVCSATFQRGVLRLSHGLMLSFFLPLLRDMVTKVKTILNVVKPSHLFVVGGFAESAVVWHVLLNLAKREKVCAIRPSRPSLAVLTGAVLFGLAPSRIRSRIVKKTYGIAVSCEWNAKKHASRPKSLRPNNTTMVPFCDGIFSPFVLLGDKVPINYVCSQTYTPGEDNQDCMILKIYQSTSRVPSYIDAPDAKMIAQMTVQMPDMTGNLQRKIQVSMQFGTTEICVTALDLTSGQDCQVCLQFLQNSLDGNLSIIGNDKTK